MNKVQKRIFQIADNLGQNNPKIEVKIKCPYCGAFTMMLKEHQEKYYCYKCEQEGPLEEINHEYLSSLMSERRGFTL